MDARVFTSHEEADQADRDYYAALTPDERVELLLQMVADYRESLGEAGQRLERVCRVAPLGAG
jgi:hypothetical protein